MKSCMEITQWGNPGLLWLLLVIVPMAVIYVYRQRKGGATITISTTRPLEKAPKGIRYRFRHLPFVLRCAAVALLIVALARPQNSATGSSTTTEGIDIVIAIDVSSSMLAKDFEPNRIVAAKDVAGRFIADRRNDRIGLVAFAGESFTLSPLTTDKATLQNQLSRADIDLIEDGTAIGNGLATAVNRLKESDAPSKVVILLTDGVNNTGQIAPMTAAEIAEAYGVRVYTIGVGTNGMAPSPTYDMWGRLHYAPMQVEIDEQILTDIAALTGGEYFRATDKDALIEIYDRINSMETSRIETSEYTVNTELFGKFVLWGFILLILEFLIKALWLRRIP